MIEANLETKATVLEKLQKVLGTERPKTRLM